MRFISIAPILFFLIAVLKTNTGRCFRFEYIVKMSIIYGIYIIYFICFVNCIYFNDFDGDTFGFLLMSGIFLSPFLIFFSTKFTIQRLYDLDMSKDFIYLKIIPIVNIIFTIILCFKKGSYELTIFDKAVNYEILLGKEIYNKVWYYTENENQQYIKVRYIRVFIRKEDFKYTIVINKKKNHITEGFNVFSSLGSFFEDDKNIYYFKVNKKQLLAWVEKNVL